MRSAEAADGRRYDPSFERRVQQRWRAARVFEADPVPDRPKWFVVELPPFANGKLHLGHLRNYTMADVVARFRRMAGYNVLYTTGFDAFGLPNENAAQSEGCTPSALVERNIAEMQQYFERLGLSHDRRRIISDHEPRFYRWVQFIFLRLLAAGYIYRRKGLVNWCRSCRSTLAQSLVEDGRCWRCATAVELKEMERWYVRETALLEPLVADDDGLPGWPNTVKRIHDDWIGRADGLEIAFRIAQTEASVTVFITTPAALHDTAFLGIGPLHPLAAEAAAGPVVDLGIAAVHPLTKRLLPVVLLRGDDRVVEEDVILGCPAHEPRDRKVWQALARDAPPLAWSDRVSSDAMLRTLLQSGAARHATRFRLRDWDIARPRYWGTPIPVVHCAACGPVGVPEGELPLLLPEDVDLDAGESPLATSPSFLHTRCPRCARPATRDTDTIETYASPWWFYLTCKDPAAASPFDPASYAPWLPVDVMIGGTDQIRTCFFHLRTLAGAMVNLGIVAERHPVKQLIAIGMVKRDGRKMSKSAGNAVDVAGLLDRYGADVLRLAILAAAAPDQDVNWGEDLLRRAERLTASVSQLIGNRKLDLSSLPEAAPTATRRQRKLVQWTAIAERKITGSLVRSAFHVAVQQVSYLVDQIVRFANEGEPNEEIALACAVRSLLRLLAPLAPHTAEHLWELSNGRGLLAVAPWPCDLVPYRAPTSSFAEGKAP